MPVPLRDDDGRPSSVLNGFGCAALPHAHLAGAFLEPAPPAAIARVEEDLCRAFEAMEDRQWMLADETKSSSTASSFALSKAKASSQEDE